uniref:Uncharacterized protein n=1 Tax=Knipowitschia caucasica TaxID=637954 RepID=A0AAV2KMQ7_KNICA
MPINEEAGHHCPRLPPSKKEKSLNREEEERVRRRRGRGGAEGVRQEQREDAEHDTRQQKDSMELKVRSTFPASWTMCTRRCTGRSTGGERSHV